MNKQKIELFLSQVFFHADCGADLFVSFSFIACLKLTRLDFFFFPCTTFVLLRQRFTTVTWSNENLRKISQFKDLRYFVAFGEHVRLFIIPILYLNRNTNSSPIHIGTTYVWTGLWLSHSTELERNASIDRFRQLFGFRNFRSVFSNWKTKCRYPIKIKSILWVMMKVIP